MLTEREIARAKPGKTPYKLFDGHGLYLLIQPNGARWWRWDYRYSGRRKTLSFGVYPLIGLSDARTRLEAARKQLSDGIDPSEVRKAAKSAAMGDRFTDVAAEWVDKQRKGSSEATTAKREWLLNTYLNPKIGSLPISQVDPPKLLAALTPIESAGLHETAHRAKVLAGQVLRYAIATGRATRDGSADLRDALTPVTTTHHAAIVEPRALGHFLAALHDLDGGSDVVRCALRFAALVFVRPGELRHAEWKEIDFKGKVWRIPAENMKMKEAHVVPLSHQAITLLKDLRKLTSKSRYLFPTVRSSKRPMSENTLNAALRRMNYRNDEMTAHGFRTIASTHLNELGFPPDVIERQLAHAPRNKVRAAYNRASHLQERTAMMQKYADFLDGLRVG